MKSLEDVEKSGRLKDYFCDLGKAVEAILPSLDGKPDNPCFFIMLVSDERNVAHYVSNAERQSCIKWLRETADRLENREDTPR